MGYFNPINWSKPVTNTQDINDVAREATETQLSVAADNEVIPIIYGQVRIAPKLAYVTTYGTTLVILGIWGHGEIDSYVKFYNEDAEILGSAFTSAVSASRKGGSDNNTIPSILTSAIPGYNDYLKNIPYNNASAPGVAYSAITQTSGENTKFPRITAVIKGLKVYDPRDGTQTLGDRSTYKYSDNPALCLADYISNPYYGMGKTVNWASVTNVANFNDTLVNGEKSRTLNLVLDQMQECPAVVETLRTYASCWVVDIGGVINLIADTIGSSIKTFDHDSGDIQDLIDIKKRGKLTVPNHMTVSYTNTDTGTKPYRTDSVIATTFAFDNGEPIKASSISLPGINRVTQANREAIERLNKLVLNDLSFTIQVYDEGIKYVVGDIVGVKHLPYGISNGASGPKLMRVMAVEHTSPGRYSLSLIEYDPAVYSSATIGVPTWPDSSLPNPGEPPVVTGLTGIEEVYALENGNYSSRISFTWNALSWPYAHQFSIRLVESGNTIYSGQLKTTQWKSPPVQENKIYTLYVQTIGPLGNASASEAISENILARGKSLPPNPIPENSLTAFEAGGVVYLQWGKAEDIDIWRYSVKRGRVTDSYIQATQIDMIDALRYQDKTAPQGTWRYWVDVIDSIRQESQSPRWIDVTVTLDSSAFLVDSYDHNTPTLTNMALYTLSTTDSNKYYITEDNGTVLSKYPGSPYIISEGGTYNDTMATKHNSITSTWLGDPLPFGQLLSGQWTGTSTVYAVNGSITSYLGLSTDMSSWNYTPGLSVKANAQGARIKHEALTTSTLKVTLPTQNVRLDAIPRSESGIITTNASGYGVVFLENSYTSAKSIQLTPQGATNLSASFDRVELNGMWSRSSSGYPLARTSPNTEVPVYNSIGYEILQIEAYQEASAAGNNYFYWEFANGTTYTTQAGDYFECEFMCLESPAQGATSLMLYNGTWGGGTNLCQVFSSAAIGQWQTVKVALSTVGLLVTHTAIVMEGDVIGQHRYALRNVRITNGSGTVRKVLWQSSADNYGVVWLRNGYSTYQKLNSNAFLVYVYEAGVLKSGAKVQWTFNGV